MSELLLIDDDQELCELLTSWLSQEGFQVRACHDGLSARKALADGRSEARRDGYVGASVCAAVVLKPFKQVLP